MCCECGSRLQLWVQVAAQSEEEQTINDIIQFIVGSARMSEQPFAQPPLDLASNVLLFELLPALLVIGLRFSPVQLMKLML